MKEQISLILVFVSINVFGGRIAGEVCFRHHPVSVDGIVSVIRTNLVLFNKSDTTVYDLTNTLLGEFELTYPDTVDKAALLLYAFAPGTEPMTLNLDSIPDLKEVIVNLDTMYLPILVGNYVATEDSYYFRKGPGLCNRRLIMLAEKYNHQQRQLAQADPKILPSEFIVVCVDPYPEIEFENLGTTIRGICKELHISSDFQITFDPFKYDPESSMYFVQVVVTGLKEKKQIKIEKELNEDFLLWQLGEFNGQGIFPITGYKFSVNILFENR